MSIYADFSNLMLTLSDVAFKGDCLTLKSINLVFFLSMQTMDCSLLRVDQTSKGGVSNHSTSLVSISILCTVRNAATDSST